MKNMIKNIIIIILSLGIIACGTETKKHIIIKLEHQNLLSNLEDNCIIGQVNSMVISDSLLIVQNRNSDSIFQHIKLDGTYLGTHGVRGQGPNEFTFVTSLNANNKNDFGFYDPNLRSYFSMESDVKGVVFEKLFNVESGNTFSVFSVADNYYIATALDSPKQFTLLDGNGNVIDSFCEFPARDEKEKKVATIIRADVYQGKIAVNRSGNKFVHAIGNARILSFCKIKDKQVELIKERVESYAEYKYDNKNEYLGLDKQNPLAYLDVCATEKYAYVLYSGKNFADNGLEAFQGKEVHVYNWEGELIKKYEIDVDVACICVDNHDETMYAIANNPDPQIVKFALSK